MCSWTPSFIFISFPIRYYNALVVRTELIQLASLSDEKLVALIKIHLKRKNIIELNEYFSDPNIDPYLEEIYNRYEVSMKAYCRKFTRDSDAIMDLFHDIFILIYLNLHRFKHKGSFKSWVYRIAHNACVNHVRKSKHKELFILNKSISQKESDHLEMIDFIQGEERDIESKLIDKEVSKILEKAIRQMPYDYINIFSLKFNARLTFEEVADILKISPRSVKSMYRNALEYIKQELKAAHFNIEDIKRELK